MYNASDRFFEAVQDSHITVSKVEVYDSSDNLITDDLHILYGNVSVDRTTATRRIARLQLLDPEGHITPRYAEDLFHPLSNNYVKIYRGIKYGTIRTPETRFRRVQVTEDDEIVPEDNDDVPAPNGYTQGSKVLQITVAETETTVLEQYTVWKEEDDIELIPQGVFDIFDVDVDDTRDDLLIKVALFDFSRRVERARLLSNYTVPAGTNYATAIHDIIEDGVPGQFNYILPDISYVTPQLVFGSSGDQEGGDRWKYAIEMAEAIGHELFFDRNGNIVLQPVPIEKDQPIVWRYAEGPKAMLLYVTRGLTKEETYNHVIATGESTSNDDPVTGEALDDDPNSPTYIGNPYGTGPYGAVPFFLRSKYITTTAQANEAAAARLRQLQGTTESMRVIATVNPAHDAGDRVTVVRQRSRLDCRFVIDSFNIQLEYSGSMNLVMRETRRT